MNLQGPIVIIEDDLDEATMLRELVCEISPSNTVLIINDSKTAVEKLRDCEKPFLIFSGINLSGLNGFQVREQILSDETLARKCIPYVFYAAHSNEEMLKRVYDINATGYFHDINDYNELGEKLSMIIRYWKESAT